jgi:hypothetical protein
MYIYAGKNVQEKPALEKSTREIHAQEFLSVFWAHSTGRGKRPLYKLPIGKRPSPGAFFLPADGQKKPGFPGLRYRYGPSAPRWGCFASLQSLAPRSERILPRQNRDQPPLRTQRFFSF